MNNVQRILVTLTCLILAFGVNTLWASKNEITQINHFQAESAFYGTPLVTDNLIVIGNHDKNIYFFKHNGELLKKYETKSYVHATATELSNGNIAIGSYDKHLYIFNKDAELLDKIKTKGRIFTNVVENDNNELVFGCNNSILFYNLESKKTRKIRTRNLIHGSIQKLSSGLIAIG